MDKIKNLMNNFYYNEVILSNDNVTELREKKNINITRLKDGINKYNKDNNTDYKLYENLEQGSIALSLGFFHIFYLFLSIKTKLVNFFV